MKLKMRPFLKLTLAALPILAVAGASSNHTLSFLGNPYQLASFNQKANPMWEFARPTETVNNWTTLLTLVDRPDARTRPELDQLAQGLIDNYKSHGGRILKAQTMTDASGVPYNYLVAAFDHPPKHQFELNFVKAALGTKNAYVVIYGVRVNDSRDYVAKSKTFLNEHSGEIGKELEKAQLPAPATLPRREF